MIPKLEIMKGKPMVNSPLRRPYLLGGVPSIPMNHGCFGSSHSIIPGGIRS